ncbi:hypothetical protein AWZ03_013202 [Drosophila navojoa]|uniref:Angiotensin-converting enzyme n=1 Tax=Drosophila navojoa TaxID=7232 RepID=A0A484AWJ5_DRONA|nr:hypothetical protein AWZ03_013202 [Drosophila navojoa]
MMKLICVALVAMLSLTHALVKEEIQAKEYLENLNKELARRTNIETEASWAYGSNVNEENEKRKNEVSAELAKFMKEVSVDIQKFNWRSYQNEDIKRQFKSLSKLGYAALPEADYAEFLEAVSSMESNFAKVKVCDYKDNTKCDLSLEPEIEEVITKSRDPEELKHYWVQFYAKAGTAVRPQFERYVELNTKAAKLNNFTSGAEVWLDEYEDETFEKQLEDIFAEIRPLYEQVHGYVRYRLRKHYGDAVVPEKGPLPMHLLGNMWAQKWSAIADLVSPFPDKPIVDVTAEMPPVVRTEKDFDAPAKYHISADVEYLRYLVSFIIQFQFYKSACIKAGQYDPKNPALPLDNCDIYGSAEAGAAFHNMLSLGASKPWPDALEAFNGERIMSGKAIAEYFEPLRVWLEAENIKNNVHIGWTASDKCVSD